MRQFAAVLILIALFVVLVGTQFRASDGDKLAAVVLEDNGTLGNLASLRTNKVEDPTAIDPSIAAVTKGGLSDPNAAKAAASGSAAGKKAPSPPKKK